jgi:hypothetical protein
MVKESPTPAPKRTGRQSPRKSVDAGDTRTERLVLRVHPNLMEILTVAAREKGVTRSAYVEQLLIGWVRLDPRNRRVDMIGKFDPSAPAPNDVKLRSPLSYAERWQKFATASQLLLGAPPPSEWFDDGEDVRPDDYRRPPSSFENVEDGPPNPPVRRRR